MTDATDADVRCDECGMVTPEPQPGEIVMPGTLHTRDCGEVSGPWDDEIQARFEADMAAIDEAERAAYREMHGVWLR